LAQTETKAATYEDLCAVPDHLVAEIIYGVLETHPRPAPPHSFSEVSLADEFVGPFQKGRGGPGGWVFAMEPELHLGAHVLVPDIAGWRVENMPHLPQTAYFETVPDFVCEILSPSTEAKDRGPKRRIYAEFGVGYLWYLNPVAKLLETFQLRDKQWLLFDTFQDGDDVKAPPFDAVTISMTNLWPLPPAPPKIKRADKCQ